MLGAKIRVSLCGNIYLLCSNEKRERGKYICLVYIYRHNFNGIAQNKCVCGFFFFGVSNKKDCLFIYKTTRVCVGVSRSHLLRGVWDGCVCVYIFMFFFSFSCVWFLNCIVRGPFYIYIYMLCCAVALIIYLVVGGHVLSAGRSPIARIGRVQRVLVEELRVVLLVRRYR